MTGKLYDYLGARRPIMTVPGDGDGVDSLLETTKAGVVCRTVREIKECVEKYYAGWLATGGVAYEGIGELIEEHSWDKRADALLDVVSRVSTRYST